MAFLLRDSTPYLANSDRAQEQFLGLLSRNPLSDLRVSVRLAEGRYYIRVQQQILQVQRTRLQRPSLKIEVAAFGYGQQVFHKGGSVIRFLIT